MANNIIHSWWPLLFYRATDAPRFRKGMIALISMSVATLLVTFLVWYLERRELRHRERQEEELAAMPEDTKNSQ
jgi:ACS family pantothenate transporter-like MFS transporter